MSASEYQWPTLSIRDEMSEFWDGWPEIFARSRRRGLVRSSPDLAMAALATAGMLLFLTIAKLYGITNFLWLRLVPWGPYHRARRERKRRDDGFRRLFLRRAVKNASRHPLSRPASRKASAVERTGDLFFGRLPPEIRYDIQLLAFGHRTIHMDLRFSHPLNLVDEKPYPSWAIHAKIHSKTLAADSHLDTSEEMGWRWFSCVCHRYPPRGTHLPLGRRRNYPWGHFREPDIDLCLKGSGLCNEWPGEWPGKCQIGIMGWILSCRSAYVEGTNILYSTNTIHIGSPVLLRSLQDIIPQRRLEEMASLELVWKPKELPLSLGFLNPQQTDSDIQDAHLAPIFPSLLYLRISFRRLVYGDIDEATGLIWPYESKALLADKLHHYTLPTIDRLLERIVPPSTEVTISCSKWDWYEMIDLKLIEDQGIEKTRPQRADIEGLRCWREIPRYKDAEDGIEGEQKGDAPRRGYWIHMPIEDVHLDQGMEYDWHRHKIYNLGEKRYRYC